MRKAVGITVVLVLALAVAGVWSAEFSSPEGAALPAATGPLQADAVTVDVKNADAVTAPDTVDAAAAAGTPSSPPKKETGLQSSLAELASLAAGSPDGELEAFAQTRGLDLDQGKVRVVLETAGDAGESAADAAALVKKAGGVVEATYADLVQASVAPGELEELAASTAISRIREPQTPILAAISSEGVADISADAWQASGHKGAGTSIAVLDLGFSGYEQRVSDGELPADVTVLSFRADGDISSDTDHGTACAEVVHDMAPESRLYLVNFQTDVELGNAVTYLVGQGVDVVSASWAWPYAYRGDGSGSVNDIVDTATAAGVFWANAAGNGAVNHWSGAFTDTATVNNWHEFSGTDEGNDFQGTVTVGSKIYAYLSWDKWPLTNQDYDLYLYRSGNPTPVASSQDPQDGSQEPAEALYYQVPFGQAGTYYISILNYGADGNADLELFGYFNSLEYQVAAGSLAGQPADNDSVMTTAAVLVNTGNLAAYSSRGPTADGRTKPDIAAPTGVSTATYGPSGFSGTSASTPHVAGAAALLKGAYPEYSATTIQSTLEAGAIDLGAPGKDNLFGSGKIEMGAPPPAPVSQLFTWYDQLSPGMRNWVLMGNPSATAADIGSVNIAGVYRGGWQIAAEGRAIPEFPGVIGGPVEVRSPGTGPLLASQRVLYNGNFNELPAVAATELDSAYYLTWYDQVSPGMESWILVNNRGTLATTVEVYIGDMSTPAGTYSLSPGETVTPQFPGIRSGPVYVRSTNGQDLVVSQRVLFNGYFSEVVGIRASGLSGEYSFNWYDQLSEGFQTWILVANPGTSPVDAEVLVAGQKQGPTLSLGAGEVQYLSFDGLRAGPVTVSSTGGQDIIASERTLMGDSFEELQGADPAGLSSSGWFTWYDQLSAGMTTYLLVSNQGTGVTSVDFHIGGVKQGSIPSLAAGAVGVVTFPGVMDGPVQVVSGGQPVLASQRTVYGDSFNEVDGIILP